VTHTALLRARWAVPLGLTLGACALGLHDLGSRDVWLDEAASVEIARRVPGDPSALLREGGNMVLYFALLAGWIALFGESEIALRLPSALFAAASVPVFHALAVRLFDRWTALLAGLLYVVNASVVGYAQEARAYALLLPLVGLSWLAFVHAVAGERGDAGDRVRARVAWAGWALASAALLYTHLLAGLVLAAQAATLALLPRGRLPWRPAAWAAAGVAVASLPVAVAAFRLGARDIDWIEPLDTAGVLRLARFLAGEVGAGPTAVHAAAWTAAGLWLGLRLARRGRSLATFRLGVPVLWLWLPTAALLALSTQQSLVVTRYQMAWLPAAVLCLGAVLAALGPRAVGAVGACVLLASAGAAVARLEGIAEDWGAAADAVLERSGAEDGVVFVAPYTHKIFAYAARRRGLPESLPEPLWPARSFDALVGWGWRPLPEVLPELGERERVWLVLAHVWGPPIAEWRDAVRGALARTHRLAERRELSEVVVERWERRADAAAVSRPRSPGSGGSGEAAARGPARRPGP